MDTSSAQLPPRLASVHRWCREQGWLRRFTLANRVLLAIAFVPTGLVKATGQRFTVLPVEDQVGFFFEAMYQTGPFWVFIGLMQIIAAILLLIPRTSALGAVLFLPVAFSVFLITWGVGFGNTVYITGAMLLAATYLTCWEGDRVWAMGAMLLGLPERDGPLLAGATPTEQTGWILGGVFGMGLFLVARGFLPSSLAVPFFLGGLAMVAVIAAGWGLGWRHPRVGKGGSRGSLAPPT